MRMIKPAALLALAASPALALAEEAAPVLDTSANGYTLLSTMLVILMSLPGIGLFYGGLARAKNALSTLEQCLAIFGITTILWVLVGYSFAFTTPENWIGQFIGGFDKFALLGIAPDSLSGVLSEYTWVIFQGAFCSISACLIVGATVERVKFSALLVAVSIWAVFSYAPLAHMVWGGGFIDSTFHAYDFAGGTVVHINAAVCGLVGAAVVGPRLGLGKVAMAPHNLPLTYVGACLLWIGWFGFNAGSELSADGVSALAFINTAIAPAAAALTWAGLEWILFKKPSTLGTASGVLAGLVAITPACAFVGPIGAICIGVVAGAVCLWGVHGFKKLTHLDDSLDVFGVHGLGGIVGALLTGIFCAPSLGGTGFKADYTSIGEQFYGQFMSVIVTIVWAAVVSFIAFKITSLVCGGLRVTAEEEREGCDLSSHGERSYNIL